MPTATKIKKSMKIQLKPIGSRVVIERLNEKERTQSGIYLPDTAKEKPQEGKVIAVGSGRLLENGKVVPLSVKVGDRVMLGKYSGTEIKIDEHEYVFVNEDEILAVVS